MLDHSEIQLVLFLKQTNIHQAASGVLRKALNVLSELKKNAGASLTLEKLEEFNTTTGRPAALAQDGFIESEQ